jgi:hypothetical protein
MRVRLFGGCAILLVALSPRGVGAQQRFTAQFADAPSRVASVPAFMDQERVDQMDEEGRMTTSGFFLGIVGMLGGAAVGSGIGNAQCGHDCVGRTAAGGAAIAGALMAPIGVHIAAVKPKRLPASLLASFATGALIWGGINAVPGRPVALAPFVSAPLQVWIASRFERTPGAGPLAPADSTKH